MLRTPVEHLHQLTMWSVMSWFPLKITSRGKHLEMWTITGLNYLLRLLIFIIWTKLSLANLGLSWPAFESDAYLSKSCPYVQEHLCRISVVAFLFSCSLFCKSSRAIEKRQLDHLQVLVAGIFHLAVIFCVLIKKRHHYNFISGLICGRGR